MSPDALIAHVAAKQHGTFTREQALDAGSTDRSISGRLKTGRWIALYPGVYALAGTKATWKQNVFAAAARFRAVASGTTAARLLGLLDGEPMPVHLTLGPGQKRKNRPRLAFHEAALTKADVRTVDAIRCTGPERTLIDLAGLVTERVLEAAFDDAIQLGLTTIPKLDAYIRDKRLEHNNGVKRLRRLIDDRAKGAMHRELEKVFRRKLRASGLPEPKRQFKIAGCAVDFVYPAQRTAIELDGLGGHFSAAAFRKDKRRNNAIVLAGYKLLHFTWEDVHERWPDVESTLRQSLHGEG